VQANGGSLVIDLTVQPAQAVGQLAGLYIVVFEPAQAAMRP
jgi:hypothetical protein